MTAVSATFIVLGFVVCSMLALVVSWPAVPAEAQMVVHTVTVSSAGSTTLNLKLSSSSLLEAMSRLSTRTGHPMLYRAQGNSAYLVETHGQASGVTGHWMVAVNGNEVSDLTSVTLQRGDTVQLTWIPIQ